MVSFVGLFRKRDLHIWRIYRCGNTLSVTWMRHVTFMNETCHTHMKRSCHMYKLVLPYIRTSHVSHMNEPVAVSGQKHERVMSHIWMRHAKQMKESCHTYEWGMHTYESYKCVSSQRWQSAFRNMSESCHTYEWAMSHIWMSRVTHVDEYGPHEWIRVNYMNEYLSLHMCYSYK